MEPELMDCQRDLLDRGRNAYVNGCNRVILQASCGAGKTYVAAEQTRRCLVNGKTVLHIVHRRRLVTQMMKILGRFDIDASPIMQGEHRWNSQVSCASRDTLLAMLKDGVPLPKCDVMIWDECHVAAKALHDWYLRFHPNAWWTGYTASPVGADGKSLAPPYQQLVCMGDPAVLKAAGRLCDVVVYDPEALGRRRRKGDKAKPIGDPVDHWKKFAEGMPTVVFAANIEDSKQIVAKYIAAGISAEHMDAYTSDDDRDAIFDRSGQGITKVISNVGVLVEGVDLPWLSCCQILRGCNSLVLYIQACGRVMRTHPGKAGGIVLDHSGAVHEYGMPDRDFKWVLGTESTNKKANKPTGEDKPVTCPKCAMVFVRKPACPECGAVLPKKKRKGLLESIKPGDGVLTQFSDGEQQAAAIQADRLERLFKKLFFMTRARGRTMASIIPIFSKEAGMPPWNAQLSVKLPGPGQWSTPAKDWHL